MKTGIELIAEERQRQLDIEVWTPEHDDKYQPGELALAGACYAIADDPDLKDDDHTPHFWPWSFH